MLRKTLTILSLMGLMMNVGAWGVSYWDFEYRYGPNEIIYINSGGFHWCSFRFRSWPPEQSRVRWMGYTGLGTSWWFRQWGTRASGHIQILVPLWMPTAFFGVMLGLTYVVPVHRCRKRKKLGLCTKCAYDLRGSKDICPECGQEFEAK